MGNLKLYLVLLSILFTQIGMAQTGSVKGLVMAEGEVIEFASVVLEATTIGVTSNTKGEYQIADIPWGTYVLTASYIGYESVSKEVSIGKNQTQVIVDIDLWEKSLNLDAIVVTGTKTFKRKTNSAIIVNVLNSEALDGVQACNLSEGLKFQPGLRVETDCQTCNYTQLRMNGLAGGYSQILINGRPIFSPLTGLYGLEQLPVNMIERIEVIRGGGSSLYGSSAIGGTVNVITKIPKKNSYELNYNYQNINGQTNDHQLAGNATLIAKDGNAGVSFFVNQRERGFYDHNEDNFSEIPLISNTSVGANVFYLPKSNQKLELSLSHLNEYRFGGEITDKPAYLAEQSEERTHNVWMGSADYQINSKNERTTFISYLAWQNTDRIHYTGIIPDEGEALQNHLDNPPYGTSDVSTFNVGMQVNHRLNNFVGKNILTFGSEFLYDKVYDEIAAYNYLIDQTTKDIGLFVQSDWEILPQLSLLSGLRMDQHNLVSRPIISPRISLLYKSNMNTQIRLNYGEGFRAPQAFDTDLHIAFAGGGISRISLSPNLLPERSKSINASINYDKPGEHFIAGFTLEAFYTRLNDAFFLNPVGQDAFGELFEKQNGQGATVQGITLEGRFNYDQKLQLETGFTLQESVFDTAVEYIDELKGIREFIRTPNDYGFATLRIMPNDKINANINYVYTGKMIIPHFAGAPNQSIDEMIVSNPFSELNAKFGYTFGLTKMKTNLECYAGVKNVLNAYQADFDIGKNRDSNFVYGPAQPRTFFVGIKFKSI